ncbi:hypothetical protein [Pseudomonas sp. TWI929]|uniref:hypothetical protein n=1 Tax=Pseudomonas sp. TWI929 TaxID=3136795 RepID=UPI003207DF9C
MTDFNETDLHTVLASIAAGTLTQCKEKIGANGLYQSLYEKRFITGTVISTLNTFVLDNVALTPLGQRCLASFTSA